MSARLQTAIDFCDESEALYQVLASRMAGEGTGHGRSVFETVTDFKQWTVNDILQHLHYFNVMADLSLTASEKFQADYAKLSALRNSGANLVQATDQLLNGLKGPDLLAAWHDYFNEMATRWADADPKTRVKWVGPDMSTRSSITARLMETWSHGQAVYDVFGLERKNADRIKNVAVIGVNTFGWTHQNRGEVVPAVMPLVELTAPSGALWTWGEAGAGDKIEGLAEEFCMVVTQTRNIADTALKVNGPVATHWMAHAQCFAGPAKDPPVAGTRRRRPPPEKQ
ncbi:MAG: TIGR03084 family metal-binding protein [Burkholderiaceae bacterium]